MALIKNATPKNSSGSYARLFGDEKLGELITKVQSTVISNGTELEKIITKIVKQEQRLIEDLDLFFNDTSGNGVFLVSKKVIKKSEKFGNCGVEPDFLVIYVDHEKKHCNIIELKDGYTFDTKKVKAEKQNLEKFQNCISKKIEYKTNIFICSFNQEDKETIKIGMKSTFSIDQIMTGKEFCKLLKIDYNDILKIRKQDAEDNKEYFIKEMLNLDVVKQYLKNNRADKI